MLRNRDELVRRLEGKPLARAVRWYDPDVLVRVGIRDAISAVFGEYADQRLMQAATDPAKDKDAIAKRYDYRNLASSTAEKSTDFWVDYIADVGDGFGPTYGMAMLLAKPELSLPSGETLPAGKILILGGDQCYPQATHEAYEDRFVLPYATALPPFEDPEHKNERLLFALPGNHDWYDGLGAFDNLFCQNRDPLLARGNGRRVGGWRCQQHRSYWAIQLPHNWWLWGVDIQFSKYLDAAQENYFRTVVDHMGDGLHNIVLCIAEPHWLDAEFEGIDTVDSLHTIVRIALKKTKEETEGKLRNREVRVRAVLAGDWHHYSHYRLDELFDPEAGDHSVGRFSWPRGQAEAPKAAQTELGIHLITAGGGGAFLHSTTDLRPEAKVSWGVRPENSLAQPARRFTGTARMIACYPSRLRSAFLTLKNLAFPLRNWRFSLVIGALYWIMTWQYHVVVKTTAGMEPLRRRITEVDYAAINALANERLESLPQVVTESIFDFVLLLGLWAGLVSYVTVSEKRTLLFKLLAKVSVGSLHSLAHLKAMFFVFASGMALNRQVVRTFFPLQTDPLGGWLGGFVYPVVAAKLGGLLGGFIFGTYWVLTGLLARMHTGDAFGALGIRNYKNFLRMKFDEHSLTIYPIGVDKLPSTKWCNKLKEKLAKAGHFANAPPSGGPPLLMIKRKRRLGVKSTMEPDLKPFLIRGKDGKTAVGPIVIPRDPHAASKVAADPHKIAAE